MTAQEIKTTTLRAGPIKRIWVNKHVLPQFGGRDPRSPVWFVECEGVRYSGFQVVFYGLALCAYKPDDGDGPHAWLQTNYQVQVLEIAA